MESVIKMIIDFHTHTYPEKIADKVLKDLMSKSGTQTFSDGTLAGLKASMEKAGVDISVILPVVTAPKQTEKINMVAAETNEGFEGTGLWSFGGIHPDNENYKEILLDIKNKGLKGIKLHPDYQGVFFNDIRYKRIVSYASELDLIVVVHAGVDIGLYDVVHCTPDMVVEMLDEVAPKKLVLAHLGGWNMWDQVYEKICGRNVYLDTAFSYGDIAFLNGAEHKWKLAEEDQVLQIVHKHGADKILFATDSPWSDQRQSLEDIRSLHLSELEKTMILGSNAEKLLRL